MNFGGLLTLFAVGVLVFAALFFLPRFFSADSRAERRRRRSNRPIISKGSRHPAVKFSVKTGKDRKD